MNNQSDHLDCWSMVQRLQTIFYSSRQHEAYHYLIAEKNGMQRRRKNDAYRRYVKAKRLRQRLTVKKSSL